MGERQIKTFRRKGEMTAVYLDKCNMNEILAELPSKIQVRRYLLRAYWTYKLYGDCQERFLRRLSNNGWFLCKLDGEDFYRLKNATEVRDDWEKLD